MIDLAQLAAILDLALSKGATKVKVGDIEIEMHPVAIASARIAALPKVSATKGAASGDRDPETGLTPEEADIAFAASGGG